MKHCGLMLLLLFTAIISAQQSDDALVLQTILTHYFKNEKPVYKGRSQLLYFYCVRANNNAEMFQVINERKLPAAFLNQVRIAIETDTAEKTWTEELDAIYAADKTKLSAKINGCHTLEDYQSLSKKINVNNQRLMIVSKPLYYAPMHIALVKVVFYRNIEHNNGAVLLLEKSDTGWTIREYLNPWST